MQGDDVAAETPGPPHHVCQRAPSRGLSQHQAQGDSHLRFVIHSVALGYAQVPARGKRLRGRLREELADDRGAWNVEVLGEALQRRLRGCIQPQHKPCAIDAGIRGNGRDGVIRCNEDRNLLKIRMLESAP
jgi:hypothetical protein